MATFTSGPNFKIDMIAPIVGGIFDYDSFSFSPTELRFFDASGDFTSLRGTGFTVNAARQVTGGVLKTIEVDDDAAQVELLLTGLNVSAKTLAGLVVANKEEAAKALLLKGNDSITGTPLSDKLKGYDGADKINGGNGFDVAFGNDGNDTITGGLGNDILNGGLDFDRLLGDAGNDKLRGNGSNDTLTGGAGADQFIFDSPRGIANFDKIVDFTRNVDHIVLENKFFPGLAAGNLKADAFHIMGTPGADEEDRILLNRNNGRLYFDPDGTGPQDFRVFAEIRPNLSLTVGDFLVT